jgi:signal transduction histidine kinase
VADRLVVRGHFEPLRRAFQNLIRNAVEAGGTPTIHVDAARVRDGNRPFVRVSIRDHGPGVPADLRERVFEPYFTSKATGTGLGLAMVRQTMNAHGGSVQVEAAEEGGARFVVTLPESA